MTASMVSGSQPKTDLLNDIIGRGLELNDARKRADACAGSIRDDAAEARKILYHEILPILSVAESMRDSVRSVTFLNRNTPDADGILELHEPAGMKYVQVTSAIDGRNTALAIELLKERGAAPMYQKISFTGSKAAGNRKFDKNELMGRSVDEHNKDILRLLIDAIQRKTAKNNANKSSFLIVVFDDYAGTASSRHERYAPICSAAAETADIAPFEKVFFVGLTGSLY